MDQWLYHRYSSDSHRIQGYPCSPRDQLLFCSGYVCGEDAQPLPFQDFPCAMLEIAFGMSLCFLCSRQRHELCPLGCAASCEYALCILVSASLRGSLRFCNLCIQSHAQQNRFCADGTHRWISQYRILCKIYGLDAELVWEDF